MVSLLTGPIAVPLWLKPEDIAGGAWEPVGYSRLGAAAASVSFQNIPAQYVMFKLYCFIINDANAKSISVTLNNDAAGTTYDTQVLDVANATLAGSRATAQAHFTTNYGSLTASAFALFEITIAKPVAGSKGMYLCSYTGSSNASGTGIEVIETAGIWGNTANLVNRIDVLAAANTFAADSVFVLLGNRY